MNPFGKDGCLRLDDFLWDGFPGGKERDGWMIRMVG